MPMFLWIVIIFCFYKSDGEKSIVSFGKWQRWGGNPENQEVALFASDKFTKHELLSSLGSNSSTHCKYGLGDNSSTTGFIAIDNSNRAILTVNSGLILSIDLETCELIWSQNITELLGIESIVYSRDTVALYKIIDTENANTDDNYSILLGTTDTHVWNDIYNIIPDCYAVSISSNGDLEWFINIASDYYSNAGCIIHGFIIGGIYAYGGMASYSYFLPYKRHGFRGKMMKKK
eukprot:493535_1